MVILRLKNSLSRLDADEVAVNQLSVVTTQPYQIGSKQIIRLDQLIIETSQFLNLELGDVLRVEGVAKGDLSTSGGQVRRRFNQNFRLVQPQISKIQNQEVPVRFRILSATAALRRRWQAIYQRVLPEPHASLVAGMTFGWNLKVSESLYQQLQVTGVLHLVAASGQNLTILAQMLLLTLTRFVSRRKALGLLIVSVAGYTLAAGMTPSIVRAAIMAILGLVALLLGRRQDSLVALGLATAIMLIWRPLWLFDVGWQLSVAATAGLLLFRPKNELGVTLAAQAATLPIMLVTFERLSLVAPLTNVLVAPLVPVIMVGGGLILVFGQVAGWLVWVPVTAFIRIVDLMAQIPFAQVTIRGLPWWWAVGYYLLLAALLLRRRNDKWQISNV